VVPHLWQPCVSCLAHHKQTKEKIATSFTLVSCSDYSSTLKMEATYSSEKSVQQNTRRYISEDRTLPGEGTFSEEEEKKNAG
jgi:hypothetical protein